VVEHRLRGITDNFEERLKSSEVKLVHVVDSGQAVKSSEDDSLGENPQGTVIDQMCGDCCIATAELGK
jgi:hypothetical protein